MIVVRELAGYKLELVGVQEVKWDKGGIARAGVMYGLLKLFRFIVVDYSPLPFIVHCPSNRP